MKRDKNLKETIGYYAILVLLLCASMNLFAKFFYFAGAAIIVALLTQKIKVDKTIVVYILLSGLMAIYNINNGIKTIVRPLTHVGFYILGLIVARVFRKKDSELLSAETEPKRAYSLLFVVAVGTFIHFMLNYFFNIEATTAGRNTLDVWTGEVANATVQASLACIMLGVSMAMMMFPRRKWCRPIGLVFFAGVMLYNMVLAGRTILVMFIIVLLISVIVWLKTTKNTRMKISAMALTFIPIILLVLVYSVNLGGIKDLIEESNLYKRFADASLSEFFNSGRIQFKVDYIKNALDYPWGGGKLYDFVGRYAHDLLLDAYSEYGIIALVLLLGILFSGIVHLIKFAVNREIKLPYRMVFVSVYVILLMVFCVEPIFAGMQWLFSIYCLINGAIKAVNLNHAKLRNR